MTQCTMSVIGRYVDDFFGVDLPNLYWTTAKMLNTLCDLVGSPCGPGEAAYCMTQMALLGALIFIDFAEWPYSHRIMPEKAAKWANEFKDIARARVIPPGQAAKVVGKLNFANQLAHGRFGRAFLRLLIRCIHAPLKDNVPSKWTLRVIQWWIEVLQVEAIVFKGSDFTLRVIACRSLPLFAIGMLLLAGQMQHPPQSSYQQYSSMVRTSNTPEWWHQLRSYMI